MATIRHLNNAPITEAVIDFRVKAAPDFNVAQLAPLKEELLARYPIQNEIHTTQFMFGMEHGQPVGKIPEKGQLSGHRFETEDKRNVAQFRADGFTFSRLKPYTKWEIVFTDAKRLWDVYVAKASPESVTRIAARYINQIPIPLPIADFSRYLTAPPNVPETLPQEVGSFLSRVTIYDSKLGIKANITQAFELSMETSECAIIILDIDTYKADSFLTNESKMWDTFAKLRNMKNRIFFEMITEDTARLFE